MEEAEKERAESALMADTEVPSAQAQVDIHDTNDDWIYDG